MSPPRLLVLLALMALGSIFYTFWLTAPPEAQKKYEGRVLDYGKIAIASEPNVQEAVDQAAIEARCSSLAGADDVLVVLRTAATELYQKVPQHLLTLFRCTPHFRIIADVETDVGGHHVYDVLGNTSAATMQANGEFKMYERIKAHQREGQGLEEIDGGESGKLDKWKFLPMLHQAYQARPKAKWFFFMEADTSVGWLNLLLLLNRLNHKRPLYFGAQNYLGQMGFADGGSGFVLSNAAMKKFVTQWPPAKQATWEGMVSRHAYGDEVVGQALLGAGVTIAPAFPMMQGERPATLDWTARHWCRPAITWHNMSSHEVDAMWKFQNAWVSSKGWKTPYLLKDVFAAFVQPHLSPDLSAWDNLSQDWIFERPSTASAARGERTPWHDLSDSDQASVESFDSCRGACFERKECVQFSYSYAASQCRLGRVVRLGHRLSGPDAAGMRSGWMLQRIERLKRSWEPCAADWAFSM